MRTICSVVLAFEVIVIGLAIPVAINLGGYPPALAGGVWGGLAAAALVLAALQRFRWGFYAACVLQAAFLASGFLVPGLAVLGVIFVGLWIAGVILGRKTDAMAFERAEAPMPVPEAE
ncbi:ABC-type multidrug transport system permease subunit [Nocardiopsis mwathae]|uniref:ABC-type multidrug transport system permease subunit n=1 Tax=Nocardiopsis mwathae TaxID=1472723 RepID=A0A7W9YG16_9ACTN|nr:DUF4233 domain-containing protein [Nocardiopsis mwathae]MBB6170851.1 ABC-type multidrug transport system permease subunit [Nocardiopsis mwathae]